MATARKTPTPKPRIPAFETIEEAATFWDTHDSTKFEDEFEDVVDVQFVVRRAGPQKAITVRLPEETAATIAERANALGIGPSTLIRKWVLERLQVERTGPR